MTLTYFTGPRDLPAGYEYGPTPTDFGAGRAAYKWSAPDAPCTCHAKHPWHNRCLVQTIYEGDVLITLENGELIRLSQTGTYPTSVVLTLLRDAAQHGVTVV